MKKEIIEGFPKLPKVEFPKFKPAKIKKPNSRYYKRKLRQMREALPWQ